MTSSVLYPCKGLTVLSLYLLTSFKLLHSSRTDSSATGPYIPFISLCISPWAMIYVNSLKSHHLVECAHRFSFRQPSLSTGVFLSSLLFFVLHRCTWWPPNSRLLSHQEQRTLVEHFSEHCLSPLLFLGVTVHLHTWGIPCSLKPFSALNALV